MTIPPRPNGRDEGEDRPPPYNAEAEQHVIGGLMANNGAYKRVAEFLGPESFGNPHHGRLFVAIGELITQGLPANPNTLCGHLAKDETMRDLDPAKYLVGLRDAGRLAGAEAYARVVHELYNRRKAIPVLQDIVEAAYSADLAQPFDRIAADLIKQLPHANGGADFGMHDAAGITAALNAHAWAALEIHKQDRLLGNLITRGTRTFLVGTTGVGKTLIGYEWVGGMASGGGFLHWTCDRPSKWIILDGEMPDELIKDRIKEVLKRHAIPPENLIIYSVGREIPGFPPMPPLNTPAGHEWVIKLAKILQPDGILFDNLMSLAPGNHAEPEPWLQTVPLVMEITRLGLAQIWCDHTGWNADRQYGTSTKGWHFDTVGILTPPAADAREEGCLTLNLTFDPPYGKHRRMTPDNAADFKPLSMKLQHGVWSARDAENTAKPLSSEGMGWFRDIQNLFDQPGVAEKRTVFPGGQPHVRFTTSRDQVREYLRKCGRIGDGPHVNLTEKDRQKLRYWLQHLRDAGKIGIDGDFVWIVS